ncbi:MAG: hypothetical protein AAB917_00325 [Patescibacteria group bacterium]
MKFNKWTLGLAALAIVSINVSPPAIALERDVGVPAITEVQMGANPATLAPLEVGAIGMEIVAIPIANESATIPEVATIMTYSSAASEKIDATRLDTAAAIAPNHLDRRALVHSAADLANEVVLGTATGVLHQEGGDAPGAVLA